LRSHPPSLSLASVGHGFRLKSLYFDQTVLKMQGHFIPNRDRRANFPLRALSVEHPAVLPAAAAAEEEAAAAEAAAQEELRLSCSELMWPPLLLPAVR